MRTVVILDSSRVSLMFGSFHKKPGGPNKINVIPRTTAFFIQFWMRCQCVAAFVVGVLTYQSFGVDIHSNEYSPLSSWPVYSVPAEDRSSLCVILSHIKPRFRNSISASLMSSTIRAHLDFECNLWSRVAKVCVSRSGKMPIGVSLLVLVPVSYTHLTLPTILRV